MKSTSLICVVTIVLVGLTGCKPFGGAHERTLSVTGSAEIYSSPDRAQLSVAVVTQGKTTADALHANNDAMKQVFVAIHALGIPSDDIKTSSFNLLPQIPYPKEGEAELPVILGYRVTNQVILTLDDLSKLPGAMDTLIAAGANQIPDVEFSLRDLKSLSDQARDIAIKNARARAMRMAAAEGVTLGPVIKIDDATNCSNGYYSESVVVTGSRIASNVPVAPGREEIKAAVNVTYAIQ